MRFTDRSVTVGEGCLGCGRCAAACPTGALEGEPLRNLRARHLGSGLPVLEIECERVLRRAGSALKVACLGGLAVHDLLGLYASRGCRPLKLIDWGLCGDCPSSDHGRCPAATALGEARSLLEGFGVAHAEDVVMERREWPRAARVAPLHPVGSSPDPARRGFLLRVAGASGAKSSANDVRPNPSALAVAKTDAALECIGQALESAIPGRPAPRIEISSGCADHGVCAALCPTGALRRYEEGDATGIAYHASLCLACGDCVRACPEHAIVLADHPDASGDASQPRPLTRFASAQCEDCGSEFSVAGTARICPRCAKARRMAFDAFGGTPGGPAPEMNTLDLRR